MLTLNRVYLVRRLNHLRWMNIYPHHFRDFNCLNNSENFEETSREPSVPNLTATQETMLSVVAPCMIHSSVCRITFLIDGSDPFKMMFLTTSVSVFTGHRLFCGDLLVADMALLVGVVRKVRFREGKVIGC